MINLRTFLVYECKEKSQFLAPWSGCTIGPKTKYDLVLSAPPRLNNRFYSPASFCKLNFVHFVKNIKISHFHKWKNSYSKNQDKNVWSPKFWHCFLMFENIFLKFSIVSFREDIVWKQRAISLILCDSLKQLKKTLSATNSISLSFCGQLRAICESWLGAESRGKLSWEEILDEKWSF